MRTRTATVSDKRGSKKRLAIAAAEADETLKGVQFTRPVKRADCLQGENALRPCPFASCKYHLATDIKPNGALSITFPEGPPWGSDHTCLLDLCDKGPMPLEDVGAALNITRERARQIEDGAMRKLHEIMGLQRTAEEFHVPVTALTHRVPDGGKYGNRATPEQQSAMQHFVDEVGVKGVSAEIGWKPVFIYQFKRGVPISREKLEQFDRYLASKLLGEPFSG